MAKVKNYYKILGVNNNAPVDEIQQAYQSRLEGITNDDATSLKSIKEAFGVLTDPNKRVQYDRYLAGLIKTGRLTQTTDTVASDEVPQVKANGNGKASAPAKAAEPIPAGVQRWSYLTLESSHNYGTTKYYIDGEMDPDLRNAEFSVVINTLGSQGWELVGISTVGTTATYVFKRATTEIYKPPVKGPAA